MSNPMREQVLSLPELIRGQYLDIEPKARCVLSTPEIFSLQRVILTGCGDSYAACACMRYAFEKFTGLRIEVVQAIELSRFYPEKRLGDAPNNPLVIAVSNSGMVARIGEALMRVRGKGALVLGITGNLSSVLAENSDKVLNLEIPKFTSAPGTRSYMVSILALYLLAVRIGEVRGRFTMDTASSYRKAVLAQASLLEEFLPAMEEEVDATAEDWKDLRHFDFIGSGPDLATAWFGMAKAYEATGDFASCVNSEEWLHLNFFMKRAAEIGTIVVAGKDSPAMSRNREMISYAHKLGRPLVVITDGSKEDFGVEARYIKVPGENAPYAGLLTQFIPLCLLFGKLQAIRGEKSGRGCEGPWEIAKGAACVRNSEIVIC